MSKPGELYEQLPKPAADATPTRFFWRVDHDHGNTAWLIGIERPSIPEHAERAAGKYILDKGEFRKVRFLVVKLPAVDDHTETLEVLDHSKEEE